jgi:predicted Zn-dependent protease
VALLSRVLRAVGHPARALELCRAARAATPALEVERVLALLQHGAPPVEIKSACDRAVAAFPRDPFVRAAVVKVLVRLRDQTAATAALRVWAETAPECAEFYGAFAQVCMLGQDFHGAQRCLSFAIELEPQRAEWHAFLALAYAADGRRPKAEERARWAVELDADCEAAWRALATACDAQKADAERRADELAGTAVDLECLGLVLLAQCDP